MANLERGFRRLTFAFSLLCASPFLGDGVLSFFETGRVHYYLLVPTAIGFVLPWLVFFVARWSRQDSARSEHGLTGARTSLASSTRSVLLA